jgi:phosphatidylinositol N-acetylglucosaminyltransferase subunit A
MITLSEPSVNSLIKSLDKAIKRHKTNNRVDPFVCHEQVKNFYNWHNVAERTQIVYDNTFKNYTKLNIYERIYK